jgi:hypothetical protein
MAQLHLLGSAVELKSQRTPPPGHWLVILQHNTPIAIHPTGKRLYRVMHTPVLGVTVRSLDARPQSFLLTVPDVYSRDGYVIPQVAMTLQVQVDPHVEREVLSAVDRDADRFTQVVEDSLTRQVQEEVRDRIRNTDSGAILRDGIRSLVGSADELRFRHPFLRIRSVTDVTWDENRFTADLRSAREQNRAEREKERIRQEERDRGHRESMDKLRKEAEARAAKARVDGIIEDLELNNTLNRAARLGLPVAAIGEPELWRHAMEQQSELLEKFLESPNAYSVLRQNPKFVAAVLSRLAGHVSPMPFGREADLALDRIDPSRALEASPAARIAPSDVVSGALASRLTVDECVASVWRELLPASEAPLAAGLVRHPELQSSARLAVLVRQPVALPPAFAELIRQRNRTLPPITDLTLAIVVAESFEEAFATVALRGADSIRPTFHLRRSPGTSVEVLVLLEGPSEDVARALSRINNPSKPTLPMLEALLGGSRIRVTKG